MKQRRAAEIVGKRVNAAIDSSAADQAAVAHAAGIEPSAFAARIRGDVAFSLAELLAIGGFLCIPTISFLEGVQA